MATKKKNTRRRGKSFTLPLAVVSGIGVWLWNGYKDGGSGSRGWNEVFRNEFMYLTSYDMWTGKFEFANLRHGALPVAVGMAAHYLAKRLGINRMLGSAGLPVIRI